MSAAVVGVENRTRERVDAAIFTWLLQRQLFTSVEISPVPYDDVQLAVGCGGEESACLGAFVKQLGVTELLVRRLAKQADGSLTLSLIAHANDPTTKLGAGATRSSTARAELTVPVGQRPEETVARLLTQIYASAPDAARAPLSPSVVAAGHSASEADVPAQKKKPVHSPAVLRAGYTLGVLGAGLLVVGATTGALARSSQEQYADVALTDPSAVDRAHKLYGRTERRVRIANTLFGVGGTVAAAGLAAVLWHWLSIRGDSASVTLGLAPARGGAFLSLDGSWRGGT